MYDPPDSFFDEQLGFQKTGKGGMTRCPQARPAPPGNREKQTTTQTGDMRIEPTKHLNMYTPSTGHVL